MKLFLPPKWKIQGGRHSGLGLAPRCPSSMNGREAGTCVRRLGSVYQLGLSHRTNPGPNLSCVTWGTLLAFHFTCLSAPSPKTKIKCLPCGIDAIIKGYLAEPDTWKSNTQ